MTLIWLVFSAAFLFWATGNWGAVGESQSISYSEFRQQLQDGNVVRVTVQGEDISGEFEQPVEVQEGEQTLDVEQFVTILPSFGDEELLSLLDAQDVAVVTQPEQTFSWTSLLSPSCLF